MVFWLGGKIFENINISTKQPELLKNEEHFYCLFENNHIVMLLIEPETGNIIKANSRACSFYGFSQAEMQSKKITEFNTLTKEQVLREMEKAYSEQRNFFIFQHGLANGEICDVEVYSGPIRIKNKNLLYSIIIDITQRKRAEAKALEYSKLLEGVLQGVPDIIGVYKPDHSIVFYNQAGYEFFNSTKKEIEGKKCFQMLGRNIPCELCGVRKSRLSKKMEHFEKYIPEIDKHMDCHYSPILDENGEVMLVIEQLRDITEQKKNVEALRRSEERYRNLFDLSPDGVGVLRKGQILIANNKLASILGVENQKDLLGKSIFDYIHEDYVPTARQRMKKVMVEHGTTNLKEFKYIKADGKLIDVEVAASPLSYQGKPAIQFVIRDITERKKQLERAALIQQQRLDTKFPLPDKASLEIVYEAADTISGDLFHFYKTNDNKMLGLLGDISGKGISAALSGSALKVLFYEIASTISNPLEILKYLNQEVPEYLGEEYVAASCFSMDFEKGEIIISGAGINSFMYYKNNFYCFEDTVKGPSLGMLEINLFEEKRFSLNKGDRFYFYSDGLENFFTSPEIINEFIEYKTIAQQKEFLSSILTKQPPLRDDVTWLAIEIK